ncbi:MAG: CHASE2 domain-containing protein [Cyanobacteria bacterium J06627_28]
MWFTPKKSDLPKSELPRSNWQEKIWQVKSALVIAPTVAAAVVAGNFFGLFNVLEWEVRDSFFRWRPFEGTDTEIVVVTIDEYDIRAANDWPIPDGILAELISKISEQSPRAIGMDLYRDLPEEPGHDELIAVFESTPELIGVEKVIGSRVDPPPVLAELGQVGLADLVLDADRRVRRSLLTAEDSQAEGPRTEDSQTEDSQAEDTQATSVIKAGMATQVALRYLAEEGISLEAVDAEAQIFQLGQGLYQPLRSQEAGYSKEEVGGYQILLNWRGGESAFQTVTMEKVLTGQVDPDLMRDRMVLIGTIAPSTNDFFETPYSTTLGVKGRRVMPGVFVHANIASQLTQSALNGRTGLVGLSASWQTIWILLWTITGTAGSWSIAAKQQRRKQFRLLRGAFVIGIMLSGLLIVGAYLSFLYGVVLPVIAPLTALALSGIATTNAYRQKSLKDANSQLEDANNRLVDYSKTLEVRVEERTRSLAAAKKVADEANQAKSDFLANMSHELRTPLNGILGYAQILQRSSTLDPKQQKGVGIIHQCGTHLLTLINDILDLSKIEARKLELHDSDFDLRIFLEGVTEICRIKAEQKGVAFRSNFSSDLPAGICADEKRLRQVMINLLGNAIKFTDQGSVTLLVQLEPVQLEPATTKDNEATPPRDKQSEKNTFQKIRFQIEDTGVGMTPAQLEKIFLPFEQVGENDRKAAGTGLGLAISQRIADMMGSPLQVSSSMGEGSTFWFAPELKVATNWVAKTTDKTRRIVGIESVANRAAVQPQVLVIDSREHNRQAIAQILEPIGFALLEAASSQQGLSLAREHCPEVILTELAMAEIDGLTLIRQLRQQPETEKAVIIVASTHAFDRDKKESIDAGADDFLPKPVDLDQLLAALQKHLKIEWQYQAAAKEAAVANTVEAGGGINTSGTVAGLVAAPVKIIPPDRGVLDDLYHLTMMGDLNGVTGILNQLDTEDATLAGFTTELRTLVQSFQTKKIREFIKSFD